MSKGSEWRKWDLHVHSPASFHHEFKIDGKNEKERFKDDIWEKYVQELEKIKDIAVIGITDYFTLDGYKKILQYRKSGRLQNFQLVLPNIEFRLDMFVEQNAIDYHLIFSQEIEIEAIEKEFLEELHVKAPNAEPRPLTRGNIEAIGKTLKEQHLPFMGKSDYVVGCENITISLDEIKNILQRKRSIFGGKNLLVLAEPGWCIIDWDGRNHLTRKQILVQTQAIFSSNAKTRDWALGKRGSTPEDFVKEFGSLKPCIHGSDAHSFENLCRPAEDRFCWIKADPSFEGLKQIVYEPEERVRIQLQNPEYRKNIYTLSLIEITNSCISDNLTIEEQKIPLNRNLIAVTGGKGSGKTALLDLIANCFEDRCERGGEDKNSFVQRIEDQKPDFHVEIGFIGEDVENFSKEIKKEEFFQDSRITYLPQGKIEEYCGDRQKLDKKIEETIFSNEEIINKGYKEDFDRLRAEIDQYDKEIDEINREIYELEEETKQEVVNKIEGEKGIKEGDLKNKNDELKKLIDSMQEDTSGRIATLKKEETEYRMTHSRFEHIKTQLEELRNELEGILSTHNKTISDLNLELFDLAVDLNIPKLNFDFQLNEIKNALELIPERIASVTNGIEERRKKLNQLSGVEKIHAEMLKMIESIKTEIATLEMQMQELIKKRNRIKSLETQREQKYYILLSKYGEWKKYYEEVIKTFSSGKSEIMSGIDFESSIYFNASSFIELGSDIFDQRRVSTEEIEKYAAELRSVISENNYETMKTRIEEFIQKIFEKKELIKKTRSNYDFYKWIFDNYFSLSTEILFKGIPMDKLSIGQKGTVLLKLFLAEGDYPLIVDQPEENLDNKFIYDELVGAFREAKKKRQVIIATNNANLVVNTDAEQIIVAEFENNKISYKLGTLENIELRKDIMPILEGGKVAFKKREDKYGI